MPNKVDLDVICAGMYRACSTWQYEVAAHLVEEHQRRPASGIPGQRRVHGARARRTPRRRTRHQSGTPRLEGDQGPRRRACDDPRAEGR